MSYSPETAFFARDENGNINGLSGFGKTAFVGGAGAGLKAAGSAMGGPGAQPGGMPSNNPLMMGAMGVNKGMEALKDQQLQSKLDAIAAGGSQPQQQPEQKPDPFSGMDWKSFFGIRSVPDMIGRAGDGKMPGFLSMFGGGNGG